MNQQNEVVELLDTMIDPTFWRANTEVYSWARNPQEEGEDYWWFYLDPPDLSSEPFNECGALAKWMADKGWIVSEGPLSSTNVGGIQQGDVIFFAEYYEYYNDLGFQQKEFFANDCIGQNYRNITHAAIVTDVKVISQFQNGNFEYEITVIEPPSLLMKTLRDEGRISLVALDEHGLSNDFSTSGSGYSVYYLPSLSTIELVCRPDLSSHSESYLEIEAENLQLHTIPETSEQVEIIKRCRACSDIEWIPAIDYDRPMPLTSSTSTIVPVDYSADYRQPIVNGKFKQGVKYKGLPWTSNPQLQANPEAFLSLVEHETSETYTDPDTNMQYPLFGWNNPLQLLYYVFDDYLSLSDTSFPEVRFSINDFTGDLGLSDSSGYSAPQVNTLYLDYIKLGDILYSTGNDNSFLNVGIITDFIKNDLGKVVQIELTEATRFGLENPKDKDGAYGNLIRRKWFSIQELSEWYQLDIAYESQSTAPET